MNIITRTFRRRVASIFPRHIYRLAFYALCISLFSCNAKEGKEEQEERDPDADYFATRNEHYGTVPQEVKDAIQARLSADNIQEESLLKTTAVPQWK